MTRLLLVEDDQQIAKALGINLGLSGYSVSIANTVAEALMKVAKEDFQVFLLDINLPDGNGIDLCHEIRALGSERPVLFLSARTDEETVVKAMNIGAEDYIRKPFGVEELKARIARALRAQPLARKIIKAGPITMDLARRQVLIHGENLNLSRREFDILTILAQKAGDVVTRESILSFLEQDLEVFDRTIDSHISHLRRKLKAILTNTLQITSVYGVGYKLEWKL